MTISKIHSKCEKCSHKDNCDNKRMMACGVLELPQSQIESSRARERTPITINRGEYGTIETSLEAISKQIKKDFYKNIFNYNFLK